MHFESNNSVTLLERTRDFLMSDEGPIAALFENDMIAGQEWPDALEIIRNEGPGGAYIGLGDPHSALELFVEVEDHLNQGNVVHMHPGHRTTALLSWV